LVAAHSFRPNEVGCPYIICRRWWLNPVAWYAAALKFHRTIRGKQLHKVGKL